MDLASYADLVVELVNRTEPADDPLRDLDSLQRLLEIRPHLGGRVTRRDLDAMRDLRGALRAVFESAARGDADDAIERLNTLLIQHPVHPQLSGHDGQGWHLHLTEGGSVPDRYAAGAAMGLAVKISDEGLDRLGVCRADGCANVFFDTTANLSRRHCSERCSGRSNMAAYGAPSRENADPGNDSREGGQ
ncbi:CGNR zinc finger domain-containing protein [Thermomonospora umbrina]|uniref:CGNR zinc finger protein n=1 Tax=Thermomonospora umbrina TaxID=111806 RepID=A0A3D9T4V3_9ACTN|nr:CGNR zinc finger domain-containing protein [Thermomonospora umbrina]REE98841.1 CGNR zinc finger protein [Thermomonospora umbrina]